MKKFILLFLLAFFSKISFSQQLLLLNRELNWKSYLSDSVNDKIATSYFPIYESELDSLITKVAPLLDLTSMGSKNIYLNEKEYSIGHLQFKMENVQGAYGERYNISLISKINEKEYFIRLNSSEWSLSANRQEIKLFLKYMKKIQSDIPKNKLKIILDYN